MPFLQGCAEFGPDYPQPRQFCQAPAKVSPNGAILVSVRAPVGRLNFADQEYGIGRGLSAIVPHPKSLNTVFTYYGLRASTLGLRLFSTGSTYDAVTVGDVGSLPILVPPLPEQTAIARFLDHANRRIRRYIRAKRKLIALLEEQKQAIIHQAVTGQIDVRTGQPYPAYKPSGVEWLGDLPEHWEVVALRHRYNQCLGKMLDSKRITGNYSLPYLRNIDIQWDRINVEDLPTMDILPEEYDRYTIQPGDLLICEGGEIGRCAIWSNKLMRCGFQKALHRLRPRNKGEDMARFMYYSLRAAANCNAFNDGHLSTIAHLTGDKLRAHRFPFPTFAEQTTIVRFLDKTTANNEASVNRIRRQIELLREYRMRLIADVVTGKLDVREAAATLPEVDPLEDEADGAIDVDTEESVDELDAVFEEAEM